MLLVGSAVAAEPNGSLASAPLAPRSGPRGATMFTELPPAQTGVVTTNDYADPRMWGELNRQFEAGSMGTGVAIGDYDGDGRPDIFVVSKTESCRLFRNLGGFKFEDVTEKAGVGDHGDAALIWKQGATFADVNNDGRLDLYVCRFNAPNLLYLNQGDGTFKEQAQAYGLDVKDASVQAAFCDYDRDGALDVFVQTNLLDYHQHPAGQRNHLFHQNRDGTFTEVTDQAGLTGEGQGHSATWWDFDNDGWPDLYVADDFAAPDQLYRNNHDGTFTNVLDRVVPHQPFSAMGSDLGDVNNDGLIDLFVPDMAASTHEKDQRGMADSRSRTTEDDGHPAAAPQYERNALYLNTGTGRCLEAAHLAGLAATDWTWSPRFEDLDNDGWLDLVVTNGMYREATNVDLLARQLTAQSAEERHRVMRDSPVLTESHFAFRNRGDLAFEDVSAAWGLNQRGVSFGSALGDLDGDGDLDLVYANYQKGVTLLRNDSDTGHRIVLDLRGTRSNRFGVGALVTLESAAGTQVRQLTLARGYLSSSEPMVHFGLGGDTTVRRLEVKWPGGHVQVFTDLAADRRYTITEPAGPVPLIEQTLKVRPQFEEVGQASRLALASREETVDESALQRLLPARFNRRGPALAVGPLTGADQDDVVVAGTTLDPLRVLRASGGSYAPVAAPALGAAAPVDDGPVLVFDADGDGAADLLVTGGGSALPAGAPEYQPRLWLNDGHGGFRPAPEYQPRLWLNDGHGGFRPAPEYQPRLWLNDGHGGFRPAPAGALPLLPVSAGAAIAADFDRDGRLDVFLGGRLAPGQYPLPARSTLLANRGGRFEDVTDALAPGLREVGLVTGALWTDVDGDGWPDLVLALEWGPVKCFHNEQGRGFVDWTERCGFAAAGTGWWTSLAAADCNGDGRPDYVVGNLGLNTQYRASPDRPALAYLGDFKGAGEEWQLVEAYTEGDRLYPWRSRRDLGAAIPEVLRRFPKTNAYARATLGEILGEGRLAAATRFAATELRSGIFLSQPDGTFRFEPLPRIAQIAPLQGIVAGDCDGDGRADLYAVQNSYAPIPAVGRGDGGLSQLLLGDGHGHFSPVSPGTSGLVVPGDAKALVTLDLDHDGWPDFLLTRNNGTTQAYHNRGVAGRHSVRVALRGPTGNPTAVGARITLDLADGTSQTSELYAGSGYYSQSAAAAFFGWPEKNPPQTIRIRWPSGRTSHHEFPAGATSLTLVEPKT